MSDEIHEIDEVEVNSDAVVEEITVGDSESAIDWQNLSEGETTPAAAEPVVIYPVARGAWDFTNTQRIILALLLWLNLMMLGLGFLAITGRI